MDAKVAIDGLPSRLTRREQPREGESDLDLVAAAQRDPAAFITLYDRYFPRVYGYVRLHVRDEPTCEDVTSQVFTAALAKINTYRTAGSFSAWLFRIAHNAVHDVYRRKETNHAAEDATQALPDSDPGPEDQVLAAERAAELRALLGTLPPAHQDLLALRYGAGLSFPEIAQTVGKSSVAVRVSMTRILSSLRQRYFHET